MFLIFNFVVFFVFVSEAANETTRVSNRPAVGVYMNGNFQDWERARQLRLLPTIFKGMNVAHADESDRRSTSAASSAAPISQFQGLLLGAPA